MNASWFSWAGAVWLVACGSATPRPIAAAAGETSRASSGGERTTAIHLYPTDPKIQLRLAQRYANGDGVPKDLFLASMWAQRAARTGDADALAWLELRAEKSGDVFSQVRLALLYAGPPAIAPKKAEQLRATALARLGPLTAAHDHRAETALAMLLQHGPKPPELQDRLAMLRSAAEAGYAPAQAGLGAELGGAEGQAWLEKAAAQGYAFAELELGRLAATQKDDAAATRHALRAAALGLPEGERRAGQAYLEGYGVAKDVRQGIEWLTRASEHADAAAELLLSQLYQDGNGVPQNPELSLALCRKAAASGLADAQVELGQRYRHGRGVPRDLSEARRWYERAAQQNDRAGQFYLALSYDGDGPDEDPKRALELYELAAAQGSAAAKTNIGVLYAGTKLKQDYEKALLWLRRGVADGDDAAENLMGLMYRDGNGVAKDAKQAAEWFSKAAEHGNSDAMNHLGESYENGAGVPRDPARAKAWYEKAAALDNPQAQLNLGLLYESGAGVDKSLHEAIGWYKKAAASGSPRGALFLGSALRFGEGPDVDAVEGCRQLLIAAKAGLPRAQTDIGYCLESGVGVTQDEAAAAYWYTEAAKQDNPAAAYRLGLMYLDGRGVAADRGTASKWLSQAAKQGNKDAAGELANLRERQGCLQASATELFGVKLGCASRRELRQGLARSEAKVTREDDNRWYDEYETGEVLDESRGLQLWYTRDNAWLARARYDFPSSVDVDQVTRIASMVARKYGNPSSRRGNSMVGEMRYEWTLRDGVRLSVWRGWPDTTTYLDYENPKRLAQMQREIAEDDRSAKTRRAASQAEAF